MLGNSSYFLSQEHIEVAIVAAKRAMALNLNEPMHYINLMSYLLQTGNLNECYILAEAASAKWPNDWRIKHNMAIMHYCENNPHNALLFFEFAANLQGKPPDEFLCDWGFVEIHAGKWDTGFKKLESRWRLPEKIDIFENRLEPRWVGEDLTGKHLMIYQDQGDGDFFQFARFISRLKRWAKHVTIAATTGLCPLLARQDLGDVVTLEYLALEATIVDPVDFYLPIGAIPAIIPVIEEEAWQGPYIKFPSNSKKLPRLQRRTLNVGVCWHGNRKHMPWRAMPIEFMFRLAEDPRIQLYSLQMDDEINTSGYSTVAFDLAPQINHWLDTVQFIDLLDVIVTIDTSMLHLCGALGKTVIGCHAWRPDWRWPHKADPKPWYGTNMMLIRQRWPGDWDYVITEVKKELYKMI